MRSLSPVVKQGVAIAKAQMALLRNEGLLEFLRTSPDVALEFLGFILLDSRSMLMASTDVRQRWVERTGDYSPDFYADLGPDDGTESIRAVLDDYVDPDAAILELGCSAGRHLSYLHEHGYENLHGIEINEEALEVMERNDPELAANGTFYLDAIETVVPTFDDDQFDVVFSFETLELLHPDSEWIFEEMTRIADGLLITVENEGEDEYSSVEFAVEDLDDFPIYYRKYRPIFTDLGFEEVLSEQQEMDMFRVFRNPE
jgi:SAM-dependent methyltransferase